MLTVAPMLTETARQVARAWHDQKNGWRSDKKRRPMAARLLAGKIAQEERCNWLSACFANLPRE
ncbi:MAG: hypothetical protein XXXNARYT_003512 [Candidatus Accumulibacter regalis]|jgi:hypothetical protein